MRDITRRVRIFFETALLAVSAEALLHTTQRQLDGVGDSPAMMAFHALVVGSVVVWYVIWRLRTCSNETQQANSDSMDESTRLTNILAVALFILALPAAMGLSHLVRRQIDTVTEQRFAAVCEEVHQELESWCTRPIYALAGTSGLYAASTEVTDDEFVAYIRNIDFQDYFPGVRQVGVLKQPTTDGRFWSVRTTAPEDTKGSTSTNELIRSMSTQRLIDQSIAMNEPMLSVHSNKDDMIWVLPVFDDSNSTEHSQDPLAVLFAIFNIHMLDDLIAEWLERSASLTISTVPGQSDQHQRLSINFGEDASRHAQLCESIPLHMGGVEFQLDFASTTHFESQIDHATPAFVALIGALLCLSTGGVLLSLGSSRKQAVQIAKRMTYDLKRISKVATSTKNIVMVTNSDHQIEWANQGFTDITGYTLDEVLGQDLRELLLVPQFGPEAQQDIIAKIEDGNDHQVEIKIRGKSGRIYHVAADIQPIRDGNAHETSGYISVMSDLTAQKQLEDELREATIAATTANEAKSRFLSSMSHEIRTPLNGIIGFADLLRRNAHDDDPVQHDEWVNVIHNSGQHLLSLLNDVLDLSKMDAEAAELSIRPCNPYTLIRDSVMLLQSRAQEKGIRLELEFESAVPQGIRTDPTRVRQILMNLISNAVKFTEEGSVRVFVTITQDEHPSLYVSVRDSGIGMTPDQVGKLFKPFQQADKNIAEEFGGTGLGLSISKGLAVRLGGDITVTSTKGVGSEFTLRISAPPLLDGEVVPNLFSDNNVMPEVESNPLEGMRILVVDDVAENRKVARLFLERAGAEVDTADDGVMAVDMCLGSNYDIVLMDIQMPNMSGIQATTKIRSKGFDKPILALTAFSSGADRDECLQAGMNDFLAKPFEPAILIQSTARWLRQSRESLIGLADDLPFSDDENPFDDPDLLIVARDWVNSLPDRLLNQISEALDRHDGESAAQLAHAIKGSGGTLGLPEFTDPASRLEKAAVDGDFVNARQHFNTVLALQRAAADRLAA